MCAFGANGVCKSIASMFIKWRVGDFSLCVFGFQDVMSLVAEGPFFAIAGFQALTALIYNWRSKLKLSIPFDKDRMDLLWVNSWMVLENLEMLKFWAEIVGWRYYLWCLSYDLPTSRRSWWLQDEDGNSEAEIPFVAAYECSLWNFTLMWKGVGTIVAAFRKEVARIVIYFKLAGALKLLQTIGASCFVPMTAGTQELRLHGGKWKPSMVKGKSMIFLIPRNFWVWWHTVLKKRWEA